MPIPCALSSLPTVEPKLPKPAISTGLRSSIASGFRSSDRRVPTRGWSTRSLNTSSRGVTAMESATDATSGSVNAASSTPSCLAKERRTKENSPTWGSAKAKRNA